jgi:hypothetical protein
MYIGSAQNGSQGERQLLKCGKCRVKDHEVQKGTEGAGC